MHCARHLDRVRDRSLVAELRMRLLSAGQTIEATRSLTLVEVEFEQRRVCLVVDRRWLALAAEARRLDADLVEGIGVPTTALVALLDGTAAQWSNIDRSCTAPSGPTAPSCSASAIGRVALAATETRLHVDGVPCGLDQFGEVGKFGVGQDAVERFEHAQ
ncbi:MAG: hypothetical protein R2710_06385 [Acidimicrobiales bacterium]